MAGAGVATCAGAVQRATRWGSWLQGYLVFTYYVRAPTHPPSPAAPRVGFCGSPRVTGAAACTWARARVLLIHPLYLHTHSPSSPPPVGAKSMRNANATRLITVSERVGLQIRYCWGSVNLYSPPNSNPSHQLLVPIRLSRAPGRHATPGRAHSTAGTRRGGDRNPPENRPRARPRGHWRRGPRGAFQCTPTNGQQVRGRGR